jgi:alpha-D-ribose 1-methylphosphonate 5-triphosphate synthase subunit PhnH
MSEIATGLADQALDSARAFRLMLDAMARPGRFVSMPAMIDAPPPLLPTAATICLTLCDYDTPLWLDETYRTPVVLDYVRFHSGAPIVANISAASFLLCSPASAAQALAAANRGTAEYPDTSATLIIQLPANPARVMGLDDRGEIAPGKRADLIEVRRMDGFPVVRSVWRTGERVL